MLPRVYSCAVIGLDGVIVEVEVDTAQGLYPTRAGILKAAQDGDIEDAFAVI